MPILQVNGKLVYFAHVPKCAGTSIEEYVIDRFGPIALQDRQYFNRAPADRWSRTSPQHIDAETLERLVPRSFFSEGFAVVRHPMDRLKSAFRHAQRLRDLTWVSFPRFVESLQERHNQDRFLLDNHFRPMSDIVPDWTETILRLEDGEGPIIAYFDRLAGNTDGARTLPHAQKALAPLPRATGLRGIRQRRKFPGLPPLDEALCRKVHALFAADYDRFGYSWDQPLAGPASKGKT